MVVRQIAQKFCKATSEVSFFSELTDGPETFSTCLPGGGLSISGPGTWAQRLTLSAFFAFLHIVNIQYRAPLFGMRRNWGFSERNGKWIAVNRVANSDREVQRENPTAGQASSS
ncbi:hypothetical protein DsansV1_C48g0243081 [Dioscorea sansibarensis]